MWLGSSFAVQARKSTFGENFVFFICNLKQLDNCLSTLAGVGLRTKNFQFLVLSHSLFWFSGEKIAKKQEEQKNVSSDKMNFKSFI